LRIDRQRRGATDAEDEFSMRSQTSQPVQRPWQAALSLLPFLIFVAPALALNPDQIALVVNARVPEGRKLAQLYAHQRHIPDGRIIEISIDPLNVDSPDDDIPFKAYEPIIARPIRDFLTMHQLQNKVTCLITFWGVPLRIDNRVLESAEKLELEQTQKELNQTRDQIVGQLAILESSARQVAPAFTPPTGSELPQLSRRLDASMTAIVRALPGAKDPAARTARFLQMISVAERLMGSARTRELMLQPMLAQFSATRPAPGDAAGARAQLADAQKKIAASQSPGATADDRRNAREVARKSLGLFGYAALLSAQADSFRAEQSESALDSELSLLWWQNYPRAMWIQNTLQWRVRSAIRQRHIQAAPTLMVTRLDAPSIQIVRNIILTSIKVEGQGLVGQVAIDARGKTGNDPYASYDRTLRNLAGLLRTRTKLKVTLEDTDALIPTRSMKDVAIYCGWYSLRNYQPPATFNAGAVGFHVASFELLSLRNPQQLGWVHGLLSDGVVGTLGPVAEPYLQSFPPADEFFPLLMTGKLTLAETYWRTVPLTSWMQTCIGDPLYNPYMKNPPLQVGNLPAQLRDALEPDDPFAMPASPATNPPP
jgi:uncharacterized protein (TIGR03790 family)